MGPRVGSGQAFCQQSRVGSGRVNVSPSRVGSGPGTPWITLSGSDGDKQCARGGIGDDFLSLCSSLNDSYTILSQALFIITNLKEHICLVGHRDIHKRSVTILVQIVSELGRKINGMPVSNNHVISDRTHTATPISQ